MTPAALAAAAVLAGVASFISPCVLPLVPGYLSMVSGVAAKELREGRVARPALLRHALIFVLGFSLVFVSFGALASGIGQLLAAHMALLSQVAGAVMIVFGLHLIGVVPLRWLYATQQVDRLFQAQGSSGAFLIGLAFGFGWTPCVGPILATILALAASEATLGKGVALLSLYSLGLAVPFLAASLAVGRFLSGYQRLRHYFSRVELVAGTLMTAMGILVFTRHLTLLSSWLTDIPAFRSVTEHFL